MNETVKEWLAKSDADYATAQRELAVVVFGASAPDLECRAT